MDNNNMEERLLASNAEQVESTLTKKVFVESQKIWKVALPTIISRVCSFGTLVITQSILGHISSLDLAGYALVQTLSVRFVNSILIGMSSATETLCGQAFGAKQYHMMGIYLQRSWIIDIITLIVLLPVFIFGEQILVILGQDPAIAKSAGRISLWFIPYVFALIFSLTIQMYLQAQQKNMVIAWLAILQFGLHILLSWLFVYVWDYGVAGAMSSLCIALWFLVLGEFVYIFGGWCPETWKGFSKAAFKDLFPVMKLSISSGIMLCLELWYNAVLVLLAGYMKNAEVAISAFSIALNILAWEFMINLGFIGAAIVRVANELGKGDVKALRFSIKVVLSTSVAIAAFFWILCLVFGDKLGYLFTHDEAVARTVASLSYLLSFSVLLNGVYPVLSGVAIGAGLQTKVAVLFLVCYYVLGIPVGAILGYAFNLRIEGIWIGMITGVVAQTFALGYMTWKTNWDEEVVKTTARLKKWYVKSDENNHSTSDHA